MARPKLLEQSDIELSMKDIPLWQRDGTTITREIAASNFASAVGMINAIAVLAETANHHPDILLYGWNKLRITLSTHDQGGLTDLDFMMAKKIDELNFIE